MAEKRIRDERQQKDNAGDAQAFLIPLPPPPPTQEQLHSGQLAVATEASEASEDTSDSLTDITTSIGEKRKRPTGYAQFILQLVYYHPQVKTTGLYVFVDEKNEIFTADEEENARFHSEVFKVDD